MTTSISTTPIRTVLETLRTHGVRALLMGGQACVLYGAAQFSRDTDVVLAIDAANLARLTGALNALGATLIAVPPFSVDVLARGHAVHFRCSAAEGTRLDVMARMRNVAPFDTCWERRTTYDLPAAGVIDVLALPDLVSCKKTRRDKDWPMVRQLVDVHYRDPAVDATEPRVRFWLRELRSPDLLVGCVAQFPALAAMISTERPAVAAALADYDDPDARLAAIRTALAEEEARERAADEAYWRPLLAEQAEMRAALRRGELSLGWP